LMSGTRRSESQRVLQEEELRWRRAIRRPVRERSEVL
jgi:hypothetical protein